jgi:hypothetical protein
VGEQPIAPGLLHDPFGFRYRPGPVGGFYQEIVHGVSVMGSIRASRREFLAALMTAPFVLPDALGMRMPNSLHLAVVAAPSQLDVLRGARMSLDEAKRAALLLGWQLTATETDVTHGGFETASGVVAAVSPIAGLEHLHVPVLNTLANEQSAASNIWHLGEQEWDATLEKFGAGQLNARFHAAYNVPMTAMAWAGWFAVKVLWESAARTRSARASDIQAFLASPRAHFDGHRGTPLRFDPVTRILM